PVVAAANGLMFCAAWLAITDRHRAEAITLQVDYSYDAVTQFFGANNPAGSAAGAQARAALDAAANYYSQILTDTFSSIQTPPALESSQFFGVASWNWWMTFDDPSTGSELTIENATIGENVYRIYAGARALSGTTLGIGGPGGRGWESNNNGGFFS